MNIAAVGSGQELIIAHAGTGTAANQFLTPEGVNVRVGPQQAVELVYDGSSSRWRVNPTQRITIYNTYSLNLAAPGASPGCVDSAGQTLTGVMFGDELACGMSVNMQTGQQLSCHVSAANTIIFRVCDVDGAATDPDGAGATYHVMAIKP